MLKNLVWFWKKFTAPEILSQKLKKRFNVIHEERDLVHIVRVIPNVDCEISSDNMIPDLLSQDSFDLIVD